MLRNKAFVLLIFLSIETFAQGPQFRWAKGIIGNDQNASAMGDISMDEDRNLYMAGGFIGSVDLDPGPANKYHSTTSLGDAYITKYDSAGNQLWIKVYQNNSIIRMTHTLISDDDFLYVAGDVYNGSIDFDPNGPGGYHSSGGSYNFTFIAKFDLNGNYIQSISIEGGRIWPTELIQDNNGSILITGFMDGEIDFDGDTSTYIVDTWNRDHGYIAKYSRNLELKWAFANCEVNGSAYNAGLKCDKDNNYILAGYFSNSADFKPGPSQRIIKADAPQSAGFIQKLDSNANLIWVETIGGTAGVLIRGMDVDSSGNTYITGTFNDSMYFKSHPRITYKVDWTNIQYQNGFIAKYDSYGDHVWSANMKSRSEVISSLVRCDNHGNVFFSGTFELVMDLDPGPGVYNVSTRPYRSSGFFGGVHYEDIYLVSLTEDGDFNWGRRFGGRFYDRIGSIFIEEDEFLYTTGMLRDSADVDPGVGAYALNKIQGMNAGYLQKICLKCECTDDTTFDTVLTCSPYKFGSNTLTEEGNYVQIFQNFDGCDSTVFLDLTFNPTSIDTIYVSECEKFKYARKTYKESGIYRVWYWNRFGCDSIIYLDLTINRLEENDINKSINPLVSDPSSNFHLNATDDGLSMICWEIQNVGKICQPNVTFNLQDTGTYYVVLSAIDTNGCEYVDTSYIRVEHRSSLFIPNSFTPNGDGINAIFEPGGIEIAYYHMVIFNRWGEKIYESENQGWDGKVNSKLSPQGMYPYKLKVRDSEGEEKDYSGAVYLLK